MSLTSVLFSFQLALDALLLCCFVSWLYVFVWRMQVLAVIRAIIVTVPLAQLFDYASY